VLEDGLRPTLELADGYTVGVEARSLGPRRVAIVGCDHPGRAVSASRTSVSSARRVTSGLSATTSLAGYLKLAREGALSGIEAAACIITGGGGRWMAAPAPDGGDDAAPLWSDATALFEELVAGGVG
jgi:hypothetical protein